MYKFHICATRHTPQKHGHTVSTIRSLAVYLWPCEKRFQTSRDSALLGKGFGHVFFSTVLADGRCPKAHVPPRTGIGLQKSYLW
jgi:hypothetical protein